MEHSDPSEIAEAQSKSTVFFSYAREDRAKALPIIQILDAAGFPTWWDGLLEGGERYFRATEDALDRAKAVVVLWSKTAIQSHWVRDEATRGRDRSIIVPLSLDGSEPPLGFGQFQVINLAKAKLRGDDPQIQALIRAVAALHGNADGSQSSPKKASLPVDRRIILGGGIALAAAGSGFGIWKSGLFGGESVDNRIVVLPFKNLSDDSSQAYFSEGLASEIRSQLSRNSLLEIVGQTSSDKFRDHKGDARSIAKELKVSYLLDGNVQIFGDQLKIVTDLVDGKTGVSKWSKTFQRKLADVFAIQSEIGTAVAKALSIVIDSQDDGGRKRQIGGTKSLAAFDAYLRGRDMFEAHVDEESERSALAKFDQAIAFDPDYAAARAMRARALAIIANQYAPADQRKSLYAEAAAEARRATKIAPDFAPAFAALGYALFYGKLDAKAAFEPYETANRLAKSDVDVLSRYAVYCARTGRFGAADQAISRASALDPLNPSMFKSAGLIKYAAKSYDEAIDFGRKALELNPKRATLHGDIGNAYVMKGEFQKAEEEFAQESNNLLALPGRAIVAAKQSKSAESGRLLDQLIAEFGDNALYQQAQILAQSNAPEPAFTALEKAYATADSGLVYLLNDPFLDPLRSDSRYKKLLTAIKFV